MVKLARWFVLFAMLAPLLHISYLHILLLDDFTKPFDVSIIQILKLPLFKLNENIAGGEENSGINCHYFT